MKSSYITNAIYAFFVQLLIIESGAQGNVKRCLKRSGKFPIKDSCTSYIICENFRIVKEATCGSGEHFNSIRGECDWEELFPCFEKPRSKHCPRLNGRFVKPESECRKYFDCCDGKPTEKRCPRSTRFDAVKEKCEWKELVTCKEKQRRKECPKPNGKFVKPYSECRKYFECRNGEPEEKKCGRGLLFNAKTQSCEYEELVDCKQKDNSKEPSSDESNESDESSLKSTTSSIFYKITTTRRPNQKICPELNGKFVKPYSECRKYFECRNGQPHEKRCGRGLLFDIDTQNCEPEELVSCYDKPNQKKCPKPNGRFVKPYSECRKYFDCKNGQPSEKKCPADQLFNRKTGKCEWHELVSCKRDDISGESSSEESDESTLVTDKVTSTFKPETSSSTIEVTTSSLQTTELTSEENLSSFGTTDPTSEESSSSFPTTELTSVESSSSFSTAKPTADESSSSYFTTESTSEDISSSFLTTDFSTEESSSSYFTTESTSEDISSSFLTTDLSSEESSSNFPTSETTSEDISSSFLTTDLTSEESSSKFPTVETTSEETTSSFLTPDSTSEESLSSFLTSDSTSEETSTSFLTTVSISEETTSNFSPTDSSSDQSSSRLPTTDSTWYETSSNFPITESTSEKSLSSFQTTDSTSNEITRDGTSEDVDYQTRSSTTSTSLIKIIRSSTMETSSESPSSTESTTNNIETSSFTKPPLETSTSDPVKDFVCPIATGYFPHPYDKHKFIGCVHYIPYEMICPSDLIYNDEQKRCVYG